MDKHIRIYENWKKKKIDEADKHGYSEHDYVMFYNETTSNGKYQVMSDLNLDKLKKYASDGIHTHAGKIYKNLYTYWVTKEQLNKLKDTYNMVRTSFN